MRTSQSILCFGEIVWDALPEGIFLGGAPLNVAYHLNKLGHPAFPVSRIGRDFLGEETRRRLEAAGVPVDLLQVDEAHHTGAVLIKLDEKGDATYEILGDAAWDFLQPEPALLDQAGSAAALVYGTLSTRSELNVRLLDMLLDRVPVKVCDVNLRKPHDDPANARRWARRADILKLNDEELAVLAPDGFSGDLQEAATALADDLGVGLLVVTCGGRGAAVLHDGEYAFRAAPKVEVEDTVGAGDAFTAGFLSERLRGGSPVASLGRALELGAFVAGRRGAQPAYP